MNFNAAEYLEKYVDFSVLDDDGKDHNVIFKGFTGGATASAATAPAVPMFLTMQAFADPTHLSVTDAVDIPANCVVNRLPVMISRVQIAQYVEYSKRRSDAVGEEDQVADP